MQKSRKKNSILVVAAFFSLFLANHLNSSEKKVTDCNVAMEEKKSCSGTSCFDGKRELRVLGRAALFYCLAGFSCFTAEKTLAWLFGRESTAQEVRNSWYDALIFILIMESARRAERDWSIFQRESVQSNCVVNLAT